MTDLQKPDFTTDTATEYKTAIDEGFQNVERTAWSFAPHPISPTPNMTVDINPGAIWNAGTLTEKAAQTTSAFTAPVTNPRIDRIVVDEVTGTYSIVAGSEAASPTAPAIPAGKFPVCQIQFETTTTSIGYVATATVAAIVDERIPFLIAGGGALPAPDFTSAEQTVTTDTVLNIAHGLGVVPTLWQVVMRVKTAQNGYSIGDEIVSLISHSAVDQKNTFSVDATNITIVQGQNPGLIISQSTLNAAAMTVGNVKWVVRTWI